MKYYTILDDNAAHTALFMIKANSKEKALDIYVEEVCVGERQKDGRWLVIDFADESNNQIYDSSIELIEKEYMSIQNYRFEIMEVNFDPEADCQEIFLSKEKP